MSKRSLLEVCKDFIDEDGVIGLPDPQQMKKLMSLLKKERELARNYEAVHYPRTIPQGEVIRRGGPLETLLEIIRVTEVDAIEGHRYGFSLFWTLQKDCTKVQVNEVSMAARGALRQQGFDLLKDLENEYEI